MLQNRGWYLEVANLTCNGKKERSDQKEGAGFRYRVLTKVGPGVPRGFSLSNDEEKLFEGID